MSIRVYGADQNPAIDRFMFRCSDTSGASTLASGSGRSVIDRDGRSAIQLLRAAKKETLHKGESIGRSNLVPFGRVLNPMLAPDRLHYEVPMAGDRTCFARHRRRRIRVSSRSLFSLQVLPVRAIA